MRPTKIIGTDPPNKKGRAVGKPNDTIATIPENPRFPPALEPPPTIVPKPRKPRAKAQTRSITYNPIGTTHPLIYGEVKNVSAAIAMWQPVTGGNIAGRFMVRYVVGYGPIQSITNIRIDGKPIADWNCPSLSNSLSIPTVVNKGYQVYTGTPNQAQSAILAYNRTGWVPTNYPGIAYVIAIFPAPASNGAWPDITNFQCDVQGLKIRDPQQDPTLVNKYFTEDAGLVIADIITNKRYGGRNADSKVNWDLLADETSPYIMEEISTGVYRYPIGIVIQGEQNLEDVIENIRAHAQLFVTYNNGKFNIIADMPRDYSGISFNDDNLLEGSRCILRGSSEVYNRLDIDYIDSSASWVQKTTEVELAGLGNANTPIDKKNFVLLGTRYLQQAKRIGTYLINRSRLDKQFVVKTSELGALPLPGDRIRITDSELNVEDLDCIVADCQPEDGVWELTLEVYDEDIFSNVIQGEVGTVIPDLPSPHDVPAPPTDLILTAETDLRRIKIEFTPAGINYNGQFTRIYYKVIADGYSDTWVFLEDTAGDTAYLTNLSVFSEYEFRLFTVTPAPYYHESSYLEDSVSLELIVTPPVVNLNGDIVVNTGVVPATLTSAFIYWDAPQIHSEDIYGASFWSNGAGLTSFVASAVNDRTLPFFGSTGVAFNTPSGSSSWLKFSSGAGNEKSFRSCVIYFGGNYLNEPLIQWSANGTTGWTTLTPTASEVIYISTISGANFSRLILEWDNPGDKGYYRVFFNDAISDGMAGGNVTEVQFSEYEGEYFAVEYYHVYIDDGAGGKRLAFPPIHREARPTSSQPLNVKEFTAFVSDYSQFMSAGFKFYVVAVSYGGKKSEVRTIQMSLNADPATYWSEPYVPQTTSGLVLANGVNSDIAVSGGPGLQLISGPTGAFSLGGFTAVNAEWLPLYYSGAQALTIVNESVASIANYRITTRTGADVTITGPCAILLWRNTTTSRWVVAFIYTGISQPLDAELTALAGLTSAADKLPYFTGSGTAALTTLTSFVRTLLDDTDASTFLSTLGVSTFVKTLLDDTTAGGFLTTLGISSFIQTLLDDANAATALTTLGAQPLDAELTALAGLVSAADRLPYFTGSGTASLATLSSFIRTLLDDANAAAALTTLGAQPLDAELTALAGLTSAAEKGIHFTGSGTAAVHDDADWIDFTPTRGASAGTWTAGSVVTAAYRLHRKTLHVKFVVSGSSVSATPASLTVTIPGGYTAHASRRSPGKVSIIDNGTIVSTGHVEVAAGSTVITIYRNYGASGAFATSVTNTTITFDIFIEIQ